MNPQGLIYFFLGVTLLLQPLLAGAQMPPDTPPISEQMVREGDFAVKLLEALDEGYTDDEAEAESRLAELGITPKNGWIADYPVTPDVLAELRESVRKAAQDGKLAMDQEEAMEVFERTSDDLGVGFRPAGEAANAPQPPKPDQTVINNYYYNQGPPVVTYYTPPPDYYYLYSWVPYPFWWSSWWFSGYFILNDFHRVVVVDRRVRHLSNHFNDVRRHRVYRVDPVERFRGRTFAGIGAPRTQSRSRGFISTGVPRSDRQIFNTPRTRSVPGATGAGRPSTGTRSPGVTRSGRSAAPPAGGVRSAPSRGGGRAGGTSGR